MNDLYYPLIGSKCFGLSPVPHQEHHLTNCMTRWYVRAVKSRCLRGCTSSTSTQKSRIRIKTINFCDIILSNRVLLYCVFIDRDPIFSVTAAYQHALQFNSSLHFRINR